MAVVKTIVRSVSYQIFCPVCVLGATIFGSFVVSANALPATLQLQNAQQIELIDQRAAITGVISGVGVATANVGLPPNIGGYRIGATQSTSVLQELRLIREMCQCLYRMVCFIAGGLVFWCAISKVHL